MPWAVDGQDGNGLYLEKLKDSSFKFIAFILEKSLKLRYRGYVTWPRGDTKLLFEC